MLEAGPHTVRVYLREDGAELDWLQLVEIPGSSIDPDSDNMIEAEAANLSGAFQIQQDPSASQGLFVEIPDGFGNGGPNPRTNDNWLDFEFSVPADGVYSLRGRVRGSDSDGDSFYVIPSQNAARVTWDIPISGSFVEDDVQDRASSQPVEMQLETGFHTVRVYLREDGAQLDWLELIPQ